jgi:butyrate kinase
MWPLDWHLSVKPITNYGNHMTRVVAHAGQGNLTPLPSVGNVIAVASGRGGDGSFGSVRAEGMPEGKK